MTHAELGEMLDYIAHERALAQTPRLRKLFDEVVRLRGVIMRKQYGVFMTDCDCASQRCDCVPKKRCAWCREIRVDGKIRHDDDCRAFTVDGVVK